MPAQVTRYAPLPLLQAEDEGAAGPSRASGSRLSNSPPPGDSESPTLSYAFTSNSTQYCGASCTGSILTRLGTDALNPQAPPLPLACDGKLPLIRQSLLAAHRNFEVAAAAQNADV